ncbi:retrovirus-related Pol polyprotein from type-1 retrotransposable element R2 [Caerostris darwini]|uniref:Retrovirus-related Pol polyprotein from type-1 retrotransposable element R2 n=1 Tax=Caerostris darwini TaxID=1538125 RepID=A0AAV4V0T6_9ARAC|nr:retrovirus-related Pol polyprotein from type-1 retrotransposable element R2 [Caerostris darwini]
MTSNVCQVVEVLDSFEASLTTSFSHGEALANFESNLNTSFSPICHRTRSQLANRETAFVNNSCSGAPIYTVSGHIGDTSQNFLLEQDVSDTLHDILDNISPSTPPGRSSPAVTSTPCGSLTGIHAEVSRTPSPLHDPPSVTITLDVDPVDTVPQQIVSPASTGDEVVLFPSATEVFDLFSSSGKSPKFDFVKLICHQCRRRFFSAGGLENHLYAVHDIHLDSLGDLPPHADLASVPLTLPEELVASCTNTGPPSCAPFSKIVPATTWATVAAKPPLSSSQPWAGQRLSSPSPSSSSPQVPAAKTHKTISFSKKPDEVEHAVLLPLRPPPRKRRKNFPCLHCDFTFRTLKSRDEHHVIHLLEDEFNALHGLACNISATDFDDFQLPRACSSKPAKKAPSDRVNKKQSGSAVSRSARPLLPAPDSKVEQVKPPPRAKKTDKDRNIPKQSSTSSSRETVVPASIHTGDVPGPTLSCHFCDRDGFPNKKALRYHLFRLHQIPMGRLEARRAASPVPPAANPLTSTSSSAPTSGPFPLVREDDTLFVDFPLRGEVVCPEPGCAHSFVCKSWSSAVWSAKKHLRIHHTLPRVQTCLRCGICQSAISKPVQSHSCLQSLELYVPAVHCQWKCEPCLITFPSETSLRNHLAGHTRANLRNAAPKLSLPAPSTKKRKRRKRGSQLTSDINEPSTVSDPAAVLAQPVLQEEFQICSDEDAPGPLSHFVDQLDRFASDQFPPITFGAFEDLVEDITQAAISHLFPDGPPTGGPSSTSSGTNMDDPATCQRLYTRNRRRAVREIVGTVSEKCKIPLGDLTQFFADSWTGGSSDPSFFDSISSEGRVDVLDNGFTPTEVWNTLKKAENTAPGPDRLTYHHLRTVDPGARILSKLFNICLKFRRVPCLWKRSTTILIPKGGDPELLSNWRFGVSLSLEHRAPEWCQALAKDVDKRCRRCGFQQESLAHVHHCHSFSHAWQLRHNAIVDRLHKALLTKGEVLSANTAVLGTPIRPDLVFKKGREIFLIDVTCPFEYRKTVFDSARARKLAHYEPLLPLYHAQGLQPHVVPILVGALGSWDPQNDSFLRRFMSRSYLNTFRRLCVSDTIKWSRDIYVEFLTGHKQYSLLLSARLVKICSLRYSPPMLLMLVPPVLFIVVTYATGVAFPIERPCGTTFFVCTEFLWGDRRLAVILRLFLLCLLFRRLIRPFLLALGHFPCSEMKIPFLLTSLFVERLLVPNRTVLVLLCARLGRPWCGP